MTGLRKRLTAKTDTAMDTPSQKQYLALYDANAATVCAHAPAVMNERRAAARAVLEATPLPRAGSEGHR